MATCIHGIHWDGISPFYCDQCAVNATGSVAASPFTFTVVPKTNEDMRERARTWLESHYGKSILRQNVSAHTFEEDETALAELLSEVAAAPTIWEDAKDEWSERIHAAFPTRSGAHEEYATAMRMVGNRHSKGELVALVTWLLVQGRKSTEPSILVPR